MERDHINEQIAYTDQEILRLSESIAEGFDRLAAEIRSGFKGAVESGKTQSILNQLGSLPGAIGRAVAGCDSSPLANQLSMRVALEQRLAIADGQLVVVSGRAADK
jgi:hypothetical protein